MRAGARLLALAGAALACAGCVSERRRAVPTYEGPLFAREGGEGEAAVPRVLAANRPGGAREGGGPASNRLGDALATVAPPSEPPARTVTGTYSGHRPLDPGTSLEERARERFLAHETRVVAREATVYVPARYAREAALVGASVESPTTDRRVALGAASLSLRRLTVQAAKVTLVARGEDEPVQVTARGDVSFRSDQPASLVEEKGLRALLIRDDVHTPLR